jgi:archaemetzincin
MVIMYHNFKALIIFSILILFLCSCKKRVIKTDNSKTITKKEAIKAVGNIKNIENPNLYKPFDDFKIMSKPKPGEWLSEHKEYGQTFVSFVEEKWNNPDKNRNIIYIQPIGKFKKGISPSISMLKEFCEIYFSLKVRVLHEKQIDRSIKTRINSHSKKTQINADDILIFLKKEIPKDAYCIIAVTIIDLYPGPSWNFVFGYASLKERVGVFSFARYHPTFHNEKVKEDSEKRMNIRSLKVLTHEISHMFGLGHCIFYDCNINGSNNLKESDSKPVNLCPVCLRKLQYSTKFNVIERYKKLENFYKKFGFKKQMKWIEKRLKNIRKTK